MGRASRQVGTKVGVVPMYREVSFLALRKPLRLSSERLFLFSTQAGDFQQTKKMLLIE
jgi:hypothetical protein